MCALVLNRRPEEAACRVEISAKDMVIPVQEQAGLLDRLADADQGLFAALHEERGWINLPVRRGFVEQGFHLERKLAHDPPDPQAVHLPRATLLGRNDLLIGLSPDRLADQGITEGATQDCHAQQAALGLDHVAAMPANPVKHALATGAVLVECATGDDERTSHRGRRQYQDPCRHPALRIHGSGILSAISKGNGRVQIAKSRSMALARQLQLGVSGTNGQLGTDRRTEELIEGRQARTVFLEGQDSGLRQTCVGFGLRER